MSVNESQSDVTSKRTESPLNALQSHACLNGHRQIGDWRTCTSCGRDAQCFRCGARLYFDYDNREVPEIQLSTLNSDGKGYRVFYVHQTCWENVQNLRTLD